MECGQEKLNTSTDENKQKIHICVYLDRIMKLQLCLCVAFIAISLAFNPINRREVQSRCQRSERLDSSNKNEQDEVKRKEAEFQSMLDDMLEESRNNIAKKGMNMSMTKALEEAKKLNLTKEDEQKAVDEFSASFVDFVDSIVELDGNDQAPRMNDDPNSVPIDVDLSVDDAIEIIKNLNLSQQDYEETVEILNDVSAEEVSDIIDFMLRARSRATIM